MLMTAGVGLLLGLIYMGQVRCACSACCARRALQSIMHASRLHSSMHGAAAGSSEHGMNAPGAFRIASPGGDRPCWHRRRHNQQVGGRCCCVCRAALPLPQLLPPLVPLLLSSNTALFCCVTFAASWE